jgi:hypothetical protein
LFGFFTTYLTWFALKADSNCFKFSSIGGMAMRAVPLNAHLVTGRDALARGESRPVTVFLILNLFKGLKLLRNHLHIFILSGWVVALDGTYDVDWA